MKTHRNLWTSITAFSNLLIASKKAQQGKRMQRNVARFNIDLEPNLFKLKQELETQQYRPGTYTAFFIRDPKPRMISAAPYRDRVVHHALCNIIAPILENTMINDTYANRKEKGSHAAADRYQYWAQRYPFVLRSDISKFFPSIDHEILKKEIRRKIRCWRTLWLIDLIIDNSNPQEEHIAYFPGDDLFTPFNRRRGLPIGNLTSQLWGNFYLNRFDHFVKENLKCQGYVRYVDDFAIFGNDKDELHAIQNQIVLFLAQYRLLLHPRKTRIHKTSEGVTFLGYRIFPTFRLLPSANVRRFRKRTRRYIKAYHNKKITLKKFLQSLRGWEGHALRADTFRLRKKLKEEIFGKPK